MPFVTAAQWYVLNRRRGTLDLFPSAVTLSSLGQQQFTAMGPLVPDGVNWTTTGGLVSTTGIYTARVPYGTYTVTATSVLNPAVSGSATVSITEATCLIDAAVAWLYQDCGSLVTYIGTGLAPPGTDLPYVLLAEISESRMNSTAAGDYIDLGNLQVSVFAAGKQAARSLGKTLANSLNYAPLVYGDGVLLQIRQIGRPVVLQDPTDFARGNNVWQESRTFQYRSAGNYASAE